MDNPKHETRLLKELISIYEKPEAMRNKYGRVSLVLIVIGLVVAILLHGLLEHSEISQNILVPGLLICGLMIGVGFSHIQASKQIPYFNKYTSLDVDAINERINEINNT